MTTTLADDDPRHGTYNGYSNLKCRCDPCTAANTKNCAEQRHKRAANGPPCTYCNDEGQYAKGLCSKCYARALNNQERDPTPLIPRPVTDEELALAIDMYDQGHSMNDILAATREMVMKELRATGRTTKLRRDEVDQRITELHAQGLIQREIGNLIGMSVPGVSRCMKRLGLKPHNPPGNRHSGERKATKTRRDKVQALAVTSTPLEIAAMLDVTISVVRGDLAARGVTAVRQPYGTGDKCGTGPDQ